MIDESLEGRLKKHFRWLYRVGISGEEPMTLLHWQEVLIFCKELGLLPDAVVLSKTAKVEVGQVYRRIGDITTYAVAEVNKKDAFSRFGWFSPVANLLEEGWERVYADTCPSLPKVKAHHPRSQVVVNRDLLEDFFKKTLGKEIEIKY